MIAPGWQQWAQQGKQKPRQQEPTQRFAGGWRVEYTYSVSIRGKGHESILARFRFLKSVALSGVVLPFSVGAPSLPL
jgi:hypothetical protein